MPNVNDIPLKPVLNYTILINSLLSDLASIGGVHFYCHDNCRLTIKQENCFNPVYSSPGNYNHSRDGQV
jgi:hypothetical protein